MKYRNKNKRIIIEKNLSFLFQSNALQREKVSELRKLYDRFLSVVRSLRDLGQPVDYWDTIIVYLLVSKCDNRSRRDWKSIKILGELPTKKEINKFLKKKCEKCYAKFDKHVENNYMGKSRKTN